MMYLCPVINLKMEVKKNIQLTENVKLIIPDVCRMSGIDPGDFWIPRKRLSVKARRACATRLRTIGYPIKDIARFLKISEHYIK